MDHMRTLAGLLILLLISAAVPGGAAGRGRHGSRSRSRSRSHSPPSEDQCSRTCVAESCDTVGMKYGKYCGAGYTGCPGEKPCDGVDACCRAHDNCVGKDGMLNVKCHEKLKKCVKRVKKSGKKGFSEVCPYETVIPTVTQGMDMAILFSQLGSPKTE